jgi:hypothetical protein
VLTFAVVVFAFGLGLLALRPSFAGPLDSSERLFVALSPAPVLLTLAVPSLLGPRASNVVTAVGAVLSVVLVIAGSVLLFHRSRVDAGRDVRLLAALLLAAMPALMIGTVAVLFAL